MATPKEQAPYRQGSNPELFNNPKLRYVKQTVFSSASLAATAALVDAYINANLDETFIAVNWFGGSGQLCVLYTLVPTP